MVSISAARKAALKFARQQLTAQRPVPREYKFTSFSLEMLRRETVRAQEGATALGLRRILDDVWRSMLKLDNEVLFRYSILD
jgi:hypothetical protein